MIIVVMGVTGAGKTTISRRLSRELGWPVEDADSFHPRANVEKMRRGVPLDDEDRRPWLAAIHAAVAARAASGENLVLACSALKDAYRAAIGRGLPDVRFVYLRATPGLAASRLAHRPHHFMNPVLVQSQFETLEEPRDAVVVDASRPPTEIVARIREELEI